MKKLVPFFFSFFLLLSLTNLNAQDNKSYEGKWVVSDSNANYQFNHVIAPSRMAHYKDSSVIVAGSDVSQPAQIFINRSTDRGESWHRIYQKEAATAEFNFYQIQHPTLSRIVAISSKFVLDSLGQYRWAYFLMHSDDTAASWTINDSLMGIYDIPHGLNFNGKYGAFRAITPQGSFLYYSEDYGESWSKYPLPADLTYAYTTKVLGQGALLVMDKFSNSKLGYTPDITTANWQYENLPDTFNAGNTYVRNRDTIWSVTGKTEEGTLNLQRNIIVGTTDGGQSWQKTLDVYEKDSAWQKAGLTNIDFASPKYGAALGTDVSYLTEDGGQTWENRGFYKRVLLKGPQTVFYYYNPVSKKRLLMALLNLEYVMKYEFNEPTSLNELQDIKSQLKVYPNPVNDVLFIELPPELKIANMEIEVLSIDGKVVKEVRGQNGNNNKYKMAIDDLTSGTYIIQLKSKNYKGSKKIIVE